MGAPAVDVRGLTWRPVGRREPTLSEVDLQVGAGERVLLAGPSGSGKSTLLRAVAGVLTTADSGTLTGQVARGGIRVDDRSTHDDRSTDAGRSAHAGRSADAGRGAPPPVGLLLQEPDDARVASRVGRDVAFGPENLALGRAEIARRVREALADVGFPYGPDHPTAALSGGERQRLALAGALAMQPPLLLLDEPLAMLDPASAEQVRAALLDVVARRGSAVVVVDHHLDRWLDVVDRLVVLGADGRVLADGSPRRLLSTRGADLAAAGLWVPGLPPPEPIDVPSALLVPRVAVGPPGSAALAADSVGFRHRGAVRASLTGVDAAVAAGRLTGLTGASGAGKSTLAELLAGLRRPGSGSVRVHPALAAGLSRPIDRWRSTELAARVGWVPQNPERGFVARRVGAEVTATPAALGRPDPARAAGLLDALGLSRYAAADPFRLSGGEQRRLALAAAVAHGPGVLVLDEPTVGQDRQTWAAVAGIVAAARTAGVAVVACTHDRAFVDALADTEVRLADGRVADVLPTGAAALPTGAAALGGVRR